jgi:hypothetical protein
MPSKKSTRCTIDENDELIQTHHEGTILVQLPFSLLMFEGAAMEWRRADQDARCAAMSSITPTLYDQAEDRSKTDS